MTIVKISYFRLWICLKRPIQNGMMRELGGGLEAYFFTLLKVSLLCQFGIFPIQLVMKDYP